MKQPQLRFKEFNNDWHNTVLKDECKRINDGTHGNSAYKDNGTVAFIICNNIKNGKINIDKTTPYVYESQKEKDDYELGKYTILISIVGTIGNTAYYNGENIKIGRSVAYLNTDFTKMNRHFLRIAIEFKNMNNYFTKRLTGTSVKALTLNIIRNTKTIKWTYVKNPDKNLI